MNLRQLYHRGDPQIPALYLIEYSSELAFFNKFETMKLYFLPARFLYWIIHKNLSLYFFHFFVYREQSPPILKSIKSIFKKDSKSYQRVLLMIIKLINSPQKSNKIIKGQVDHIYLLLKLVIFSLNRRFILIMLEARKQSQKTTAVFLLLHLLHLNQIFFIQFSYNILIDIQISLY
ncbi:unnamed protein product (macronuclear) [Paramecium tetraurelia]|uniref:Transmembrane protein n=1 Tax=Paramecium tetraurelia TaxID=5888 RepID=A0BKC8_PARTE|nr:uncharacterized protein GSPATT00029626001 [Paramecium tetraurelia]CAK58995.1 unnamed protein product [Paramecium tetraurelia]|eukprot:XP_001426393.1 hypothetical protein (macronuclear) [Paramecium tetraurelia strain d4-2]